MWSLVDKSKNAIELKENETITVGRSNSDILLTDDASISRVHAKIQIAVTETNKNSDESKKITKLIITDCKSKYGTYLLQNGATNRITDKGYVASHMDQIRFGLKNHIYTVIYKCDAKYLVLTSGLTSESKKKLEKSLKLINGKLIDRWQENCTHLTASTTGLTEKISCALAAGVPIVTLDYWNDVRKALEAKEEIPDFNNYMPPFDYLLRGMNKVTLCPNPERRLIFKGLNFFYFDQQQCHLYSTMINLAGGKFVIFDESSFKKADCADPKNIFVQPSGDTETQDILLDQYTMVNEALKDHGLRSIPTTEIPLAILHCSREQYCNPKFKYRKLLLQKDAEKERQVNKAQILVPETQDLDFLPCDDRRKKVTLPETVTASQSQTIKSQILGRPFEDFDPSLTSASQRGLEQEKVGSIVIDNKIELEKGEEEEERVSNKGQLTKISNNKAESEKDEEIKTEIKEEEEEEAKENICTSSTDKLSIWDEFTCDQNEEAEKLRGISDSDEENDGRSKKRTKQPLENSNKTKKKKFVDEKVDEIDIKEEIIEVDEKPSDLDLMWADENHQNKQITKSEPNSDDKVRNKRKPSEDDNENSKQSKKKVAPDPEKNKNGNEKKRLGSTANENSIDKNIYQDEDQLEENDVEEDENQNSSKWIRSPEKKNNSSNGSKSDGGNTKVLMNTSLGCKMKFVSLEELQGEYVPFKGKRNSQGQKRSSLIPKRLTSADFHKWVPPKTVNKAN